MDHVLCVGASLEENLLTASLHNGARAVQVPPEDHLLRSQYLSDTRGIISGNTGIRHTHSNIGIRCVCVISGIHIATLASGAYAFSQATTWQYPHQLSPPFNLACCLHTCLATAAATLTPCWPPQLSKSELQPMSKDKQRSETHRTLAAWGANSPLAPPFQGVELRGVAALSAASTVNCVVRRYSLKPLSSEALQPQVLHLQRTALRLVEMSLSAVLTGPCLGQLLIAPAAYLQLVQA
eukprot:1141460-Pelagomonas_calceolata.AAC.3